MFAGEYHRQMDEEREMYIPLGLRKGISQKVVIAKGPEGCIYICALRNWRKAIKEFESSPQIRKVQIGENGKIRISKGFKEYAELEREVVFVGCGDHIEIWNPKKWLEEKKEIGEIRTQEDILSGIKIA